MLPQPEQHILPRNLHGANLPHIHHTFLLLRRIISLTNLVSFSLRLSRHLMIPKWTKLSPVLALARPLRSLHKPRVHGNMRAARQVDSFGRIDARGSDNFAEHGVVEGRVQAESLAEDGVVEGHLFCESWGEGDVGKDLESFGAQGGKGFCAGWVGEEGCYEGCERGC
jgi:hypothetical protein